jgi:hypothetical protein
MYAWLWRRLPGPTPVRLIIAVALLVGVVALLLFVIYPVVDPNLPFNHVNVSNPND